MPVTDWKQAATAVNVDRSAGAAWANPANASGSDDLRAVCDVGKNDFGDWLRLTNFGFDGAGGLPADAGLATCEVEIERQSEAAGNISDSAIFLRVTAGQVGVNQASATGWTTNADTTATYSFSVAGLTAADIRTVDFGIEISADNSNGLSAREARIDNLRMRWVYDLALGGAYSLGGQVAALKLSRRLSAAAGAIALNGNPAILARRLAADAGSLVVTGRAATLGAARQLTAAPGAVVPTGQPAGLRVTRLPLSAGLGAHALAGKAATLSESGSPPTLAGETGSHAVAGQPAALKLGRVLAAAADAYALAGKDAALRTGGAPNPPGRRVARGMMVNVGRFIGH